MPSRRENAGGNAKQIAAIVNAGNAMIQTGIFCLFSNS
jgi:hypothetical protein